MAFLEVLVYDRVAYKANEVGDAAAVVPGNVEHLAMVLGEVERIEEASMGTYVADLVVDKEI